MNKLNLKLSIIVPVYNAERFLEKCIVSLCELQDISRSCYEVIAINDGSTDESCLILKNLLTRFENIIVINQDNRGQSAARNAGLSVARGEYIIFVDADDWIRMYSLGSILHIFESEKPDILYAPFQKVGINGEVISKVKKFSGNFQCYGGYDFFLNVMKKKYLDACCTFSYKRDFLNRKSLRFLEGVFHEDTDFITRSVLLADKVIYWDNSYYFYLIHNNSTMHNRKNIPMRIDSLRIILCSLTTFRNENFFPPSVNAFLNAVISSMALHMMYLCFDNNEIKIFKKSQRFLLVKDVRLFYFDLNYLGFRSFLGFMKRVVFYYYSLILFRIKSKF